MKPILTHTFNGHKVNIDLYGKACDGIVDCPYGTNPTPTMRIFCDLKTRDGLESVIHETLHVIHWNRTEAAVEKAANELAKFLWRIGYRKEL